MDSLGHCLHRETLLGLHFYFPHLVQSSLLISHHLIIVLRARRTCSPLMCLPKPMTARGHQGTSLSQSASCCKLYDFVTRWWLLARYEKKNANFSRKFYFRVHFTVYTEWEMLNFHHVNFQIAYVEQCRCSCLENVWSQNPAFTSTCLTFIITYMRGSDLS